MTVPFIAPVGPIQEPSLAPLALPSPNPVQTGPASFGSLVGEGLRQVDNQLNASRVNLQQLATGDAQNLHQIMIKLEETRLSFQLMLQVRNRMLESYQEVMRMQV